jgi:hypothetical protein
MPRKHTPAPVNKRHRRRSSVNSNECADGGDAAPKTKWTEEGKIRKKQNIATLRPTVRRKVGIAPQPHPLDRDAPPIITWRQTCIDVLVLFAVVVVLPAALLYVFFVFIVADWATCDASGRCTSSGKITTQNVERSANIITQWLFG